LFNETFKVSLRAFTASRKTSRKLKFSRASRDPEKCSLWIYS